MKTFIPALRLTFILLFLFSGIYPLVVAFIGKFAPGSGKGITITSMGKIVGYENIGQSFISDRYFHGRPSAVNYNASGSGGSNKAPFNPEYHATVQARIDTFISHNPGVAKKEIPADLITASGSGLDPHISPRAATIQVKRIAQIRGITEQEVTALVAQHIEEPLMGLLGPEKVNVLKLNIALDQLKEK